MYPVYYPIADDTLPHLFDTFDGGDGSSITMTGLAVTDIEIYKDGGVTQRSSDAGYTLLDTDGIDFDGITGIHGFSIDLSDNTDAGFFTVGPWYHVVISSITVDAQTVSFVACAFRILAATRGMAGTALPDAAADAAGGLPISDAGGLDLDTQIGTDIDAILVDTADMQPRVAAIEVDTGTTLQAELDGIQADTEDLQTQIGAAGAGLSAVPWNASWDAEVQSECTDALNAYDAPTKAEMDTGHGLLATEAKQDVIDGIVDGILVDTGTTLPATLSTIDGKIDTIDNFLDTEIAAILEDTGTTLPATLATIAGYLDTEIASIISLLDDARGEPAQGAPPVNPDAMTKIDYLYKFLRNKILTSATEIKVYNDAGAVIDHKSTISDDGTDFTRGEFGTGA